MMDYIIIIMLIVAIVFSFLKLCEQLFESLYGLGKRK